MSLAWAVRAAGRLACYPAALAWQAGALAGYPAEPAARREELG
jgi:hypothetical protein